MPFRALPSSSGGGSSLNWRHKQVLNLLNMNAIPNNIPKNMINPYMWALEYGSLTHKLPKKMANKLMHYRNASKIYQRALETRRIKNEYPNLSYDDAFLLSHIGSIKNASPNQIINGYKSLRRRGLSNENAVMKIASDPMIARKYNAADTIKRSWKRFANSTTNAPHLSNPKFRAKIQRYMNSANRETNKYFKRSRMGIGGSSPKRRALMTELLRKRPRRN